MYRFFPDILQRILHNFTGNKNNKFYWKPSIFELHHRLLGKEMKISIYFDEEIETVKQINEFTTVKNVFDSLLENSENMKKIKEKTFYWIYVDLLKNGEYISVFAEER